MTRGNQNEREFRRLLLWLIRFIGVIVPRRFRARWQQEWQAELEYREAMLARWDKLDWRNKLELLWRSLGAFRDALWLQRQRWEDEMIQDLRFGVRMLLKSKRFSAVAVLTLALGVGANTAIFSVVNAVLLRPLPYHRAEELVGVYNLDARGESEWPYAPAAYLNLKKQNQVFADIAALSNKGWPANLTGEGTPERLQGFQVSANLFQLLGVAAAQGRTFLAQEDRPGNHRVVVISHELWQRQFGADPAIAGRKLTLNGDTYVVVGVMPADFRLIVKTDLWTPLAFTTAEEADRDNQYLEVIARLKHGVSLAQARAETEIIARGFSNQPNSDIRAELKPPQTLMTQEVRPLLFLLLAAAGFVLLIACANVANLLLARASVRRRELAIRAALGAGRLRVMRQLLVESAMLALLGGAGGLLLAHWGIEFLVSGLPEYLTAANARVALLKLDATALGFTFALSLLTTILFGLVPALQISKVNLNEALKDGGRNEMPGRQPNRLRGLFIITELALATLLLLSAGLMLKSFWRLSHKHPGYEAAGVLTAQIDPSEAKYGRQESVNAFYRQTLERVAAIPDIRHVGIINSLNVTTGFAIDEHPPVPPKERPVAASNQVSADYFRAMGIPLRAGRFFSDQDVASAPPVVLIDETLARRHFANEDPIGKHLRIWKASRQVVGVVGSAQRNSLREEPAPHVYLPYQQENWGSMSLIVRANSGNPTRLTAAIRRELAAIDRDQPIHSFKLLEQSVAGLIAPQRFSTQLLAIFATLAALLAGIGVYGVMSYAVAQRTHEIGVRMALGAQTAAVLKLVMTQGLKLTLTGIGLGLIAAFGLTRLIQILLFDVSPTDPLTFTIITLSLIGTALLACYLPARRAAKVDPLIALRCD